MLRQNTERKGFIKGLVVESGKLGDLALRHLDSGPYC